MLNGSPWCLNDDGPSQEAVVGSAAIPADHWAPQEAQTGQVLYHAGTPFPPGESNQLAGGGDGSFLVVQQSHKHDPAPDSSAPALCDEGLREGTRQAVAEKYLVFVIVERESGEDLASLLQPSAVAGNNVGVG